MERKQTNRDKEPDLPNPEDLIPADEGISYNPERDLPKHEELEDPEPKDPEPYPED